MGQQTQITTAQSLRVKLIAPFIIGTVILAAVLAWYTYSSARQAVQDAMLLISETKTAQVEGSVSLFMKSTTTSLHNMVTTPQVLNIFNSDHPTQAIERATEWLNIMTQSNEYYRDILIVDIHGNCIVSSNSGHVGKNFSDRPFVVRALQGMFAVGEFSVGRVTKRFSSISAGPIDGRDGVMGALIVFNDFPRLVDYKITEHDKQVVSTSLLAPNGMFMANIDKKLMGNSKTLFQDLYTQLVDVGEAGGTVYYTKDGQKYIGYAKLEPYTSWLVITSGREEAVFASASTVGFTVLGLSLAILCLVSFVVIRFANGILNTLLALILYAKTISEGKFGKRLGESKRKDELGVLHESLVRMVEAMQEMLAKSEDANKMKGQFLANMSHEIRTPLNAILGMAHLSLRDPDLSEKQNDYVTNIQVAAKTLLGLINDILDLSKVEAGMMELEEIPFNLQDAVENILTIHRPNAKTKGVDIVFEYAPDLPLHFLGDPLRIGQVLNNLLSNALKFTKTGSVKVTCFLCDSDSLLLIGYAQVCISVEDTGIGMAKEAIPKLFQSFTQADSSITRKFGGTGLGLAISDRIVSLLGGSFNVESEIGQGTTFTFSMVLPLDTTERQEAVEDLPLEEAMAQLGIADKTILVAEDNTINQLIMEELLAPTGATILMVNNGKEAVEAVQSSHVDIVFMDMQMPIMGGIEATIAIREFCPKEKLPIIAVTANAMKEDKEKGYESGMNDYITKPIEPKNLLEMLRVWLKKE